MTESKTSGSELIRTALAESNIPHMSAREWQLIGTDEGMPLEAYNGYIQNGLIKILAEFCEAMELPPSFVVEAAEKTEAYMEWMATNER
jgi:hypothetical protein